MQFTELIMQDVE